MTAPERWPARAAGTLLGRRYPFVLCYHGVGPIASYGDPLRLFVSRELFSHHLDVIQGHGYELLPVTDLWRSIQDGSDAAHTGSITFDDGLVRTAHEGVSILLERRIPCSMFISTGLMGKPHPDLDGAMIMTAAEVVELASAGVEIGAHSVDHVRLDELDYAEALDQLRRSRAVLEDLIGRPVKSMAYPYGRASERTISAAREAGYEIACVCAGPGPWESLSIPREPIYSSVTPLRLRLKMAGLYGPVHAIKSMRTLAPTQRI
ncbi:MAG TPA: polysaccharide deacetylase family protein [Solirubrobacteraceae bacterium]|nr:polysaccharide deacetylase family protein [Solirubrobacteraceae bacterium]